MTWIDYQGGDCVHVVTQDGETHRLACYDIADLPDDLSDNLRAAALEGIARAVQFRADRAKAEADEVVWQERFQVEEAE